MRRRPYRAMTHVPDGGGKSAVAVGTLLVAVLLAGCGGTADDDRTADSEASASSVSPASSASQAGSAARDEASEPTATKPPGPAQKLADGDGRPVEYYEDVLAVLAPRCEEDVAGLVTVVDTTLKGLRAKGVEGETEFSVLQHLEHWVPAGQPRTACASSAKDYVASRDAD
ncbi:hypothetical protein ACFUIW_17905 [Streptomyces sp. NPDC057245]|uniref:hypothetical protein n=1 Tax=Streptomyces TaxID=1883 RepID=UPI001C1E1829|nr:hypothetical protein [Streptomyces sp. A108]MBU6534026.1 hypothetical protein [Streptomyces sp. A108]